MHVYLVVALQSAFVHMPWAPLAKFAVVGALAVPVCFLAGHGLRHLPGMRAVF